MTTTISTYNKIATGEAIKIETFDVTKRYTKPHKHNKYLEIVLFTQGTGFHHLDMVSHDVEPPVLFLIHKDEVHHWEITTEPKGFVVIIKESFLEQTIDKSINVQLLNLNYIQKIKVPELDISLELLFKALSWEMKQNTVNQEVIEGGLKAILAKIVNYASVLPTDKTDISVAFNELLLKKLKNNVSFYANSLNVTSQNLNAICQKTFNKTASEVIAIYIIREVKRQLLYTTKTISEIAYDLSFKDTSHFTKYFKRYTQQTPLQFKKENL